jgi:hypothetical protein
MKNLLDAGIDNVFFQWINPVGKYSMAINWNGNGWSAFHSLLAPYYCCSAKARAATILMPMLRWRSASARISKGHGYQGLFFREQFWSKKGNLHRRKEKFKKMDRISLLLGSIKCFPTRFQHKIHFRGLPDRVGIINRGGGQGTAWR